VLAVCGTAAGVAFAFVVNAVQRESEPPLLNTMYFAVVPLGAIAFGLLTACGYWIGAKRFNVRPGPWFGPYVPVVSTAVFLVAHWLHFRGTSDGQTFAHHIDSCVRRVIVVVGSDFFQTRKTLDVGRAGWWLACVQIAASAAVGLLCCRELARQPGCDHCAGFLGKAPEHHRYFANAKVAADLERAVLAAAASGTERQVIDRHATTGDAAWDGVGKFRTTLQVRRCRRCGRHMLRFTRSVFNGREWVGTATSLGFDAGAPTVHRRSS
jgi:hypothetical protein